MRAIIMDAPHEIRVGDWETPQPATGEVLVSVAATGICAGDMYFYLGKNPYAVYPQVCGHEIAGVVAGVGEGVTGFAEGAPVVVEPFLGCGRCYACRVGKSNCCVRLQIIGVHTPGGYAEYLTAPVTHVHTVPEGLSLTDASFAEPVAIGVQACRRGQVGPDDYVFVLGVGPIGLALIEVARARGARVLATDVLAERLETARSFGAETLPADENLAEEIRDRTDGDGMPVVMEATGSAAAIAQTVDLVAAGGRVVILGLLKQGLEVVMPGLDFTKKELTIMGSRASVNCFPEALDLMATERISYPKVATTFDLWDAPAVFRDLAENPGKVHKAVLTREI